VIDLSSRLIQTPPTMTRAANGNVKWHPYRRALQALCGVALVALPLTNGLRLDVRRDEFFFAWHRMAAHDLFLLFWVAMLGVWGLTAVSFLYGRLWCGWVCPQTLASDFAESLQKRLDKAFGVRKDRPLAPSSGGIGKTLTPLVPRDPLPRAGEGKRRWASSSGSPELGRGGDPAAFFSRAAWVGVVLAMSLGMGVVLACYWLAPRAVGRAALHPLADIPAALTVYGLAAVLAADMLWVRRKFCKQACPYGALMGLLADKNTLAVRYLEERHDECIGCHKCEVDCPMGIDIKNGVGQHACIGCGECIDSCNTVLGKRGVAGLIEFRYGLEPERQTKALARHQRWGLWDARRGAVVGTGVLCLGVVLFLLYGHLPLRASVVASGAMTRDARQVHNTYSLTVANGQPQNARYALSVDGLPQGVVEFPTAPIEVAARGDKTLDVTIAGPSSLPEGRIPIRLRVRSAREQTTVRTIFYAP